ncbi:uncharacterized protein LOC143808987 [Ranitomeya variabilis]|uniref:uncharacterized protein LOC143808987 n=1 Tax=Ranitomeya variabilis TaxID=490064 RepID=UPI00405633AF
MSRRLLQDESFQQSTEWSQDQSPQLQLRRPYRILMPGLLLQILNHRKQAQQQTRRRACKRMWVHPLVAERTEKDHFYVLYTDLRRFPSAVSQSRLLIDCFTFWHPI